jgi:hypothetical protein
MAGSAMIFFSGSNFIFDFQFVKMKLNNFQFEILTACLLPA